MLLKIGAGLGGGSLLPGRTYKSRPICVAGPMEALSSCLFEKSGVKSGNKNHFKACMLKS